MRANMANGDNGKHLYYLLWGQYANRMRCMPLVGPCPTPGGTAMNPIVVTCIDLDQAMTLLRWEPTAILLGSSVGYSVAIW